MVQYVQPDVLANLCGEPIEPNLGTLLVEVVASVLDNEVGICGVNSSHLVIKRILVLKLSLMKIEMEEYLGNLFITILVKLSKFVEDTKFNRIFSLTTKTFTD